MQHDISELFLVLIVIFVLKISRKNFFIPWQQKSIQNHTKVKQMRIVRERHSEMLFTSLKLQKKETALVESEKNKWFESIHLEKNLNKISEKKSV